MKKLIATSALLTVMISCSHDHAAKNFSDGQVSKILTTRNDGEVLLARHVIANSKNADVKEFAQHMIDDHGLNDVKKSGILTAESIEQEDSWKSNELQNEIIESQNKLLPLKDKALDVAYIDDQIEIHEGMIEGIKTNLIPVAKEPSLKKHLELTVKKDEIHLQHAKFVRSNL